MLHWLLLEKLIISWPPCRPWPLSPGSWGLACSSRGGAAGGAAGLHRWWCCAPGAEGQTCGRTHQLQRTQTYLDLLLHGWTRCRIPVRGYRDVHLVFTLLIGTLITTCTERHTPLCREQWAGSSHVQTQGWHAPTPDQSPIPRWCRWCQCWKYLSNKSTKEVRN